MLTKQDLLLIPHLSHQNLPDSVSEIVIDSRLANPGALFVAIIGERHNAHDYVKQVLESGAAACVVEQNWFELQGPFLPEAPLIVVPDTTLALGHLANIYRKKFTIPFVAIAGSNGKTSTKELIAHLLSQHYQVLKTEGNFNNHIGMPLTLFRVRPEHQIAVIEIGTNHFGEIDYLCQLLEPTHGLITNIGQEHLEFFKDLDGVAKAEGELFDYLAKENRLAFVNVDDEHVARLAGNVANRVSYALEFCADSAGKILEVSHAGQTKVAFEYDDISVEAQLQVPGLHAATNALAAFTVAASFGVPANKLQAGLASFRSGGKRMEVLEHNGFTIINDCYNANPDSMRAALRTLGAISGQIQKFAVIGNMAELGDQESELHRGLLKEIEEANITQTFTIGKLAKHTFEALKESGKPAAHFESKRDLADALKKMAKKGDVVLVKGSRSAALEEVTELLMKD